MAKHSVDSRHTAVAGGAIGLGLIIHGILAFVPANKTANAVREGADRAARDDARAEKARSKAKKAAAELKKAAAEAKVAKEAKAAKKAAKAAKKAGKVAKATP
jgi:hypothetical protein